MPRYLLAVFLHGVSFFTGGVLFVGVVDDDFLVLLRLYLFLLLEVLFVDGTFAGSEGGLGCGVLLLLAGLVRDRDENVSKA